MWRSALALDRDAIVAMSRGLYREDPSPEPGAADHMPATLLALSSEPVRGRAVVLEVRGLVQGYALLISFWSNELGGEICTLDELYVSPEARGQGHATRLIEALLAKEPGIWPGTAVAFDLEVTPANARARALYSSLGFNPTKNARLRFRPAFCNPVQSSALEDLD